MKVAIFFSGGKDSTLAALKALENSYDVFLITFIPEKDSYLFHTSCLEFPRIQAKLMNLDIEEIRTSGEKEKEVEEVISALKEIKEKRKLDAIWAGCIKSKYQKERIERIAKELNVKAFFPFWNKSCEEHWNELLTQKFKITITKIATYGLSKDLMGKIIDKNLYEKIKDESIKYGFDLCFEGGEAETLVLDCPIFSKEIEIKNFEIIKDENSFILKVKDFKLKRK